MKQVAFKQYLHPDGQAVDILTDLPDDLAEKAAALERAGYKLECEIFHSGLCSFTISDGEEDLFCKICSNGPNVTRAVYELITDGYRELVGKH